MAKHAKLSPSAGHRWFECANSVPMSEAYGAPEERSEFAAEGSCAHMGAEVCLASSCDASALAGRLFEIDGRFLEFTSEMAEGVQVYLDYVRGIGGQVFCEQRLPIHHLTGEEDAHGTADAIVIRGDELWIVDLKFGRGERIVATDNHQLLIYGLAAMREFELTTEFNQVHLCIVQPRLNHIDHWTIEADALEAFAEDLTFATAQVKQAEDYFLETGDFADDLFNPGEKQCRWCRAKGVCPALSKTVLNLFDTFGGSKALTNQDLGEVLPKIPLIRDWVNGIESQVERELLVGHEIPGFKLVEGRRGPRKWTDPERAAQIMCGALERSDMYEQSLISPTTAEKRLKKTTTWTELQAVITQADGKPVVAANDDPRPTVSTVSFQDLT